MQIPDSIIDLLMDGDAAIRWQTLRDLLDAPQAEWQAERRRTLDSGWGAQLLAQQDEQGMWGGGLYSPKWTSNTYTLLALIHIGIPPDCTAALKGARLLLDRMLGETCDESFARKVKDLDRCIVGMFLQIAAYFDIDDPRREAIVTNLLQEVMPDGGWNCRKGLKMSARRPPHHSSFHTTFSVLDGLREYAERSRGSLSGKTLAAEAAARELMLPHHLYFSDHTGEVINPHFTQLVYPYRWHFSFLRALEYFARAGAPRDERLREAIDLLISRRKPDGLWPLGHRYSGVEFFHMERIGKPSRWVTLRALRVLRWWEGG